MVAGAGAGAGGGGGGGGRQRKFNNSSFNIPDSRRISTSQITVRARRRKRARRGRNSRSEIAESDQPQLYHDQTFGITSGYPS